MTDTHASWAVAIRRLELGLLRRRIGQLDLRMRLELLAIGALIGAFLFWQFRIFFAAAASDAGRLASGVRHASELPPAILSRAGTPAAIDARGASAVAFRLGAIGIALMLGAGLFAGLRHARRLRADAPGPAWLALPLPPVALNRHLAWESRTPALWVALPAAAALVAATGLMPAWWQGIIAAAFVWLWIEATRAGCAIALRAAAFASEHRNLPPVVRALSVASRRAVAARTARARWRRLAPWRALMRKDWRVTRRPSPARRRVAAPLAFAAGSLAVWSAATPFEDPVRVPLAFALTLLFSAALAEWIVAVSGTDPFAVLRTLPLSLASVWGARMGWVLLGSAPMLAAQALLARPLSPQALHLFLVWSGLASLAIGVLAVNYSVTLFPRADLAERLLSLSLGLAVAASLMIPLSGWIVLLAAVAHSTRRLRHWQRLEEA